MKEKIRKVIEKYAIIEESEVFEGEVLPTEYVLIEHDIDKIVKDIVKLFKNKKNE